MKTSKTIINFNFSETLIVFSDGIDIILSMKEVLRTKSESYVSSISETDGDCEGEDHEEPVDLGNIDLT